MAAKIDAMNINDGVPFTRAQARDLGLTSSELRESVETGEVRRLMRGVFVAGSAKEDRALRARALGLVVPETAIVALHTAAWLYGVDTFPPSQRTIMTPHLLVPHGSPRPKGGRAITRQTVVPDYEAIEVGGVRVTSPLRTTTDLLRLCWRPHAMAAGDSMVRAGAVDPVVVREHVMTLRRFPGVKQAKELAPRLDAGSKTPGESWMKCRLLDAGLPTPTYQHEVTLDGHRYFLDAAYVEQHVAAEFDGREHHLGRLNEEHDDDRRGDMALRLAWVFVIATYERVFGADGSFEREVGALLGVPVLPRSW